MNTATMELNALRGELMHTLCGIEDLDILKKVKRTVDKCAKRTEETEYIDKAEVLDAIREGLREVKEARRTGKILTMPTLKDFINEL